MTASPKICTGRNRFNEPCKSYARPPNAWCWFHDPETSAARTKARLKGSLESKRRRGKRAVFEIPELTTLKEGRRLLGQLPGMVSDGQLTGGEASTVRQAVNDFMRALEAEQKAADAPDLAKMLKTIEALKAGAPR